MRYFISRVLRKLTGNKEHTSSYLRKKGALVGKGCNINCDISTSESYLIEIGNDVTVAPDVMFITHDASVGKIVGKQYASDLCGKIMIGNNCFIGARSIILYGCRIPDNTIVAAGALVANSFTEEKTIIAGNPAKVVSTWSKLEEKTARQGYQLHGKTKAENRLLIESSPEKLVVRK